MISTAILFIPAMLLSLGALIFGAWAFIVRGSKSSIGAALFAVGSGLAALVLGVFLMYTITPYNRFPGSWWPGCLAFAVYFLVFIVHVAKNAPKAGAVALGLVLGLLMLCLCGLVLWLMVACGMGDCV